MRPETSIIGSSAALAHALDRISRLATIDRPALILGPRGSGKELAAERLHFLSPRWSGPLHKVNCAALADSLLESELFGHEAGAFTGATRLHRGRFERAEGGTLFLDEMDTMSPRLQEKLLRLIEYGEFERLGGQRSLQADVRIVAATSANLQEAAARGRMREDLLDRLAFDVVHLPSLAQRPEDIPELAEHIAQRMCRELGWTFFPGFAPSALQQLLAHNRHGNVRELKNAVERSLYRWETPESPLAELVLDPFLSPYVEPQGAAAVAAAERQEAAVPAPDSATTAAPAPAPQPSYGAQIASLERQLLSAALARCGGHQGEAARDLGLSYDQLRGQLRKHGLLPARRGLRTRRAGHQAAPASI
jgi:psp operon transcriptional activator